MQKGVIQFSLQVIGYGTLFAVCALLVSTFWYSFDRNFIVHYEVPQIVQKYLYLQEHQDAFDTFFVGSSATRRHIIPQQFDEIAGTQSFNFGVDGLRSYRIKQIADLIVETYPRTQTIMFELRAPEREETVNFKSNPVIYAVQWSRVPTLLDWIEHGTMSEKKKREEFIITVRETAYKYLGVGIQKHVLLTVGVTDATPPISRFFADTYDEFQGFGTVDDPTNPGHMRVMKGIERGYHAPERRMEDYYNFTLNPERHKEDAYMRELRDYALELKQKGITIVFVAPARMGEIPYLRKTVHYLSEWGLPVLNMMDPDKFPEFFTKPEYTYDMQHFNIEGAKVYTDRLAHEYLLLQNAK